jgi:hypothetical protein
MVLSLSEDFLTEDVILSELLPDDLSDVLRICSNYSECDSDDFVWERKIVRQKQSYSESKKLRGKWR